MSADWGDEPVAVFPCDWAPRVPYAERKVAAYAERHHMTIAEQNAPGVTVLRLIPADPEAPPLCASGPTRAAVMRQMWRWMRC